MQKKHRRHHLRAKQAKSIIEQASAILKVDFSQIFANRVYVERVETDFAEIFILNGRPMLFKVEEKLLPTLAFNELFASTPRVIVDMGAVPYVCNGANVMAPGIVEFQGDFGKGDLVLIVDEKHGKAIAIGEALYDIETVRETVKGPVARNLHFVGDRTWTFIANMRRK